MLDRPQSPSTFILTELYLTLHALLTIGYPLLRR